MYRSYAAVTILLLLTACAPDVDVLPVRDTVPELETFVVEPVLAPRERVWDGVVEAVDQATLSAQTAGRVVELPFDVNDYVAAGDVVVRFTDVEQQAGLRRAEAALQSAQAAFTEAQTEFERIRDIHERGLVARAQLDQALARRDGARAALDAAQAALQQAREQVEYTVVRAPYTGIVTARHVEVGESVSPGQPLISGLSLDRLRVQVDVPQSDVPALREFGRAAILLGDAHRLDAERVVIFPYADPVTHSFRVRVELPEAETGLHPGMTVKVAFVLGETERLLIPASALVRRSEVSAVYVIDGTHVVLRQVRIGHRFDDGHEVLSGLAPGETVALDPLSARLWLAAGSAPRDRE
jgi:RND family efflux transporter MFP subunit